jgi:DNA-dependent RNA polymerase auxiliary subunit epsilon|tara:strand:- start:50 stop:307 length:258 start_codon:yes stop_codon:yes gene_type:complete
MDDELDFMEEIFQVMDVSPEVRKQVKEEYKAHIEFYDSLSEEEKRLEREGLELITENMTLEKFLEMSDQNKEGFTERLKKRLAVN